MNKILSERFSCCHVNTMQEGDAVLIHSYKSLYYRNRTAISKQWRIYFKCNVPGFVFLWLYQHKIRYNLQTESYKVSFL